MKKLICDFPTNWDTSLGDSADWCKHHIRLPHYEEIPEIKDIKSPGGFDSWDSGHAAAEVDPNGLSLSELEKDLEDLEAGHLEEINDSWWERLEDKIAKRTWLENIYWWFKRHIKETYWWIRNAPYYFSQYLKRGFSDRQLWSLDVTIAKFVAPRLKRLKEIKHGHPVIEADEELCLGCWTYPEMWNREKCYWDPKGDFHLDSEQVWNEYMDKMIYAMDSIAKNEDWDPPMDDITSLDIRTGNDKWEAYTKERDEHWIKLKEGIKLFGEFFGGLWD